MPKFTDSDLYIILNSVDITEALRFWYSLDSELEDYNFIKSVGQGGSLVRKINGVVNLGSAGEIYIEGLFKHDNFLFLNNEIVKKNMNMKKADFSCDYSISIDLNLIKYISNCINGYNNMSSFVGFQTIKYLTENDLNYDFNLFYWENHAALTEEMVFGSKNFLRNMQAIEIMKDLDSEHFLSSGQIRPRCGAKQIEERIIDVIKHKDQIISVDANFYNAVWKMTYLSILMAVEIQNSSKKSSDFKTLLLLERFDSEIGLILLRDLFYLNKYFESPASPFFSFIQPKNPNLFKKLRGLAWDLHIFRVLERFSSVPHNADFMIPYVMTFDKRYSDMMKVFKVESSLYQIGLTPLTSPDQEIKDYIDKRADFQKYFSRERHDKRMKDYNKGDEDISKMIMLYENKLKTLMLIPE